METKSFDYEDDDDNNNNNNVLMAIQRSKPSQELDEEKLQHGLAKLILTLVQTLTDILERRAMRRIGSGTLTEHEVERLGLAFMQMRERTASIASKFGLQPEELGITLTQDKNEHVTLVDIVDKLIDQGTVIAGDVSIAVAGIDLAKLRLLATLTSE